MYHVDIIAIWANLDVEVLYFLISIIIRLDYDTNNVTLHVITLKTMFRNIYDIRLFSN